MNHNKNFMECGVSPVNTKTRQKGTPPLPMLASAEDSGAEK